MVKEITIRVNEKLLKEVEEYANLTQMSASAFFQYGAMQRISSLQERLKNLEEGPPMCLGPDINEFLEELEGK